MDIALIDPSLFTWPYDLKLAKGLLDIGHKPKIIGCDLNQSYSIENNRLLKRHFYPGLHSRFFKRLPRSLQLGLKGLSHTESMARLLRHFKNVKPDIIHFQWTPLAVIDGRFIPSFRRIAPTILTVHDSNPFNNNPSSRLQQIGALKIFHEFDHLIVHTEAACERVLRIGIPEDKISIVPHGLLTDHIETTKSLTQDKRFQLLLFGQIKPYKGVDVLLKAVALLPREVREMCVIRIVGRPEMQMGPLFSMVEDLQLQKQVEFDLRFVPEDEVPRIIAAADVLVFPYREIDASGVLMLAIAAGRPIVASNIGIFAEWLGDQTGSTLVPPDNPSELSNSLMRLISDPEHRHNEMRKILSLRDSIPSWVSIAYNTEAVYEKAMQRREEARTLRSKDAPLPRGLSDR